MVQEATAKLEQILDSAVKIEGKAIDFFKSATITGSGSEQDTAHGLLDADFVARVPILVFVVMMEGGVTGQVTEGTHDATNVKVTAPSGMDYKVIAI